ncbi:MAG TPA: DinB family protein, partial [Gemmatimonadales bacterium]|nr:DinB family protein [Gemmatimonadales bacterium]
DLSLEECAKHLAQVSGELLESLDYEPLSEPISYINSKGERWSSTVEDILTHIVIHSAYHRGQIASDLRAEGHEPAYTDYIHAVRQRFVE